MRDPLVETYKAIKATVRVVHGSEFTVRDEEPNPVEFKASLPAVNISYVSGTAEKALMREYEPHGLIDNGDNTFTAGIEVLRFDYLIQVTFFGQHQGTAQRLATEFLAFIEQENDISIPGDKWGESVQIFATGPPRPPRGEVGMYQCELTFSCRGKLIVEENVNAIDISGFKPKVNN